MVWLRSLGQLNIHYTTVSERRSISLFSALKDIAVFSLHLNAGLGVLLLTFLQGRLLHCTSAGLVLVCCFSKAFVGVYHAPIFVWL